jgi:hypothetical protein
MKSISDLPVDRARARLSLLEQGLRKCPDFQIYLITKAGDDRRRMENLLMENPNFRLWYLLSNSSDVAHGD